MKHWDKYDLGGVFDVFDFDKKMALINLDMIYEYAVKLDTIVTEESQLEEWVKMKLTRIEQNVSDVAHSLEGWEKFDEGGMIFKKQLLSISKYAHKLIEMIKGGSKLMSWQENKLAISANDIDNLYHHLDYKVGNRASQNKFATGGMMKYPDLSNETPIVINEPNNQKISEIDIALIDIALVRQDLGIEKTKIGSSNDAYQIFKQLWNKDSINVREEMNVLFLNNANEPIGYYEHTKGAINSTLVDVEMIGALALKTLSKGVILAHNHPSGNNKPSEADIKLYQQVKTALKMFNVTVLDSMILVPNSDNYYSLADNGYEMGGMVLSNKEIIKNIDFSDNTDRRLGRYDFSFETEDSEGASILDYDGYIIEAPSSSRMNDEIEWGQNVPEDWENAEKYILDEFYNWKKRFKTGGGVGDIQISVNAQRYLEMLEEMYPNFLDIDTTTPSKDINKAISELEEKGLIKRLSYSRGFAEYGLKDKKYAKGGGIEVVGKGNKGAFRKREYDGMSENDVIGFWESRGYKISKTKSEGKLKPYTFYINKYANGGGVGVYRIVEGYDHYKGMPLYNVIGDNDYIGEYHTDRKDAEKELQELIGGVGEYKVGDTFIGTPNSKYDASWQLFKPSTSYVIDNKTNKIISIHNTPYDAIVERDNTNPNFKTHFKVYPKEHYKETGGGVGQEVDGLIGKKVKVFYEPLSTSKDNEKLPYYYYQFKGLNSTRRQNGTIIDVFISDEKQNYYKDKYSVKVHFENDKIGIYRLRYVEVQDYKDGGGVGYNVNDVVQLKNIPENYPYEIRNGIIDNKWKIVRVSKSGRSMYSDIMEDIFGYDIELLDTKFKYKAFVYPNEVKAYIKYANGGGVSSELSEPQKEFSKSAEMLVRENLQNGEICMCKLKKILGHEPNYPKQVIGSLVLEKAYLRNYYKI